MLRLTPYSHVERIWLVLQASKLTLWSHELPQRSSTLWGGGFDWRGWEAPRRVNRGCPRWKVMTRDGGTDRMFWRVVNMWKSSEGVGETIGCIYTEYIGWCDTPILRWTNDEEEVLTGESPNQNYHPIVCPLRYFTPLPRRWITRLSVRICCQEVSHRRIKGKIHTNFDDEGNPYGIRS